MFGRFPKLKEKAIALGLISLFEKKYKSRRRSANTAFNAGIFMFNLDVIRNEKFEKKSTKPSPNKKPFYVSLLKKNLKEKSTQPQKPSNV